MKNFSLKTKRNSPLSSDKRAWSKVLLFLIIAVITVALLRGVVGTIMSGISTKVAVVSEYFKTSSATLPSYIRDRNELIHEIGELRAELAASSGSESTIARLLSENEELRQFMGDTPDERTIAGVIARPPFVPYDLLVIDRGSSEGIEEGALVYEGHNHAIGVISKVFRESSLVTLFSSAGAETTVYLYGPNVFAYAHGEGGGVIRISVPQGITLREGDPVVLPSIHEGDMGVIERVESLPSQPEQNAYLTFPVSIQSIRTVSIAKTVTQSVSYTDILPNISSINDRFKIEVPDSARSIGATTTEAQASTTPAVP